MILNKMKKSLLHAVTAYLGYNEKYLTNMQSDHVRWYNAVVGSYYYIVIF